MAQGDKLTHDDKLVTTDQTAQAETLPDTEEPLRVGDWYWVNGDDGPWFACIVHLGSNYAELEAPDGGSARILYQNFDDECSRELQPDAYIDERIGHYQNKVHQLMGRVKELTARLGVGPSRELSAGSETAALVRIQSHQGFDTYSTDLVKAKETTLPELFKAIENANESLATWMTAKVVPLKAHAKGLHSVIDKIDDRIFSVELYAGLTEHVELIADGEPAAIDAKVHLLQRRCYMDEECLTRYETGGMAFADIRAFEAWLTRADNRDRLLPFPRCVVSFRVRRHEKEREAYDLRSFFRILDEKEADKCTFLYIRNGERVYRMQTELEFGERLFPDLDQAQLDGEVWAKSSFSEWTMVTDNEFQGMREEYARKVAAYQVERAAYDSALKTPAARKRAKELGKRKPDASCVDVPWPGHGWFDDPDNNDWHQFNPGSVYYDDIAGQIEKDIKHHNRVALILQGLLDRSPVLHPHPPWELWTNEGFHAALEMVYDDTRALHAGDKPDFEAYRKSLNASLRPGSVTVGQQDAWLRHEGTKETRRRTNDYRYRGNWYPDKFQPDGNPGPGVLAKLSGFGKRTAKCSFAWKRQRAGRREGTMRATFTCPSELLLNVDAYTPGDFKQFFGDPRTRQEYLKWAPLLLEAEEYHAGNRPVADAVPTQKKKPSTHEGRRRYRQRKLRKELLGKAVRLVFPITTRGGTEYPIGSLWRVTDGSGRRFSIVGINADGSRDERFVMGVLHSDFDVAEGIPDSE